MAGIFKKFNFGLKKTRNKMAGAIDEMLDSFDTFEDDLFVELEEILVMSDVGVQTAVEITEELRDRVKKEKLKSTKQVKDEIKNIVAEMLDGGEDMGLITQPSIILVIGVNGVGKTTTIGKMAAMYKEQGKKVILGAADTFRAAAIDQLEIWAQRAGVDIIKHKEGADPAAVIFDTIGAGKARMADILICDTAGRLHNKKNLMEELRKIYKVIDRELPYSDREVLLVLDATTGQNAVSQAREFMQVADITGIVLTKLDGTARGGVVLAIKNELKIPVKFIGVGEGIDDLQPFNPKMFAESLFNDLPEGYKEKENEVLPVYEKPLEKVELTDTSEAEEIVREFFEEIMEGDEGAGHGGVSDGADNDEDNPQGERASGDKGAGEGSGSQREQGQENTAAEDSDKKEDDNRKEDSGSGAGEDSLYGSIDKFYL